MIEETARTPSKRSIRSVTIPLLVLLFFSMLTAQYIQDHQHFVGQQQIHVKHNRSTVSNTNTNDTVRVLFGASGSDKDFIAELQVALKSVLLNAPLDRNLEIHYMADEKAFTAIQEMLHHIDIQRWNTRTQISLYVYNTQSHMKEWTQRIDNV